MDTGARSMSERRNMPSCRKLTDTSSRRGQFPDATPYARYRRRFSRSGVSFPLKAQFFRRSIVASPSNSRAHTAAGYPRLQPDHCSYPVAVVAPLFTDAVTLHPQPSGGTDPSAGAACRGHDIIPMSNAWRRYSANGADANCKHDIAVPLAVRRLTMYKISGLHGKAQARRVQYRARTFIGYPCAPSNHCYTNGRGQ